MCEPIMQDGHAKVVDLIVECPKCHQESRIRVATGVEIETLRKSIYVRILSQSVD
jgi:hypothetical protein